MIGLKRVLHAQEKPKRSNSKHTHPSLRQIARFLRPLDRLCIGVAVGCMRTSQVDRANNDVLPSTYLRFLIPRLNRKWHLLSRGRSKRARDDPKSDRF